MTASESNNRIAERIRERSDEGLARLAGEHPHVEAGRLAASELLSRYKTIVYRWCYRYVQNHDQAMDLAQDVLVSAYRNLGAFREGARFSSWLFAIARNRCFTALRKPSFMRDEECEPDRLVDSASPADQVLERMEEEEAVIGLLRRHLEPREQQAFWLRCFERMPVETITRVLNIREASGARGVLQSARRKLRAALAGQENPTRGESRE